MDKQDKNKGPETEGQKQGEEPVVDTSSLQVTDENDDPVDMPPEGADEKDDLTKGLPEGFESVEQLVDAFNDMKNKSSDADDKDDEGSDDKDDEGSDDGSDDNNQTKDNERIHELELQLHDREVYDLVGGKEKYEEMQAWADNALDEDEADTFNQVFDSSDIKAKRVAAKALQAMYERENGFEGERINGNTPQVLPQSALTVISWKPCKTHGIDARIALVKRTALMSRSVWPLVNVARSKRTLMAGCHLAVK